MWHCGVQVAAKDSFCAMLTTCAAWLLLAALANASPPVPAYRMAQFEVMEDRYGWEHASRAFGAAAPFWRSCARRSSSHDWRTSCRYI